MRHGICILPEYPWAQAQHLWRRAEELGFDHAWTYDHLVWGGLPDAPWHSTVATLTAAAMVTSRIGLGTLVSSPNFRHPVALARDVVTLEDISGGRVLLGVGAGGDLDSGVLGEQRSRGERSRRFGEFVPLLDRCLREDHVTHEGDFYRAVDARNLTPARTPLLVAAEGPRAMRLAVQYAEGWVTTGPASGDWAQRDAIETWWAGVAESARRFTEIEQEVREAAGEDGGHPDNAVGAAGGAASTGTANAGASTGTANGRASTGAANAGASLDRYLTLDASGPATVGSADFLAEQVGRAEELGFTDVIVHWPRPEPPYHWELAVLEGYLASIGR